MKRIVVPLFLFFFVAPAPKAPAESMDDNNSYPILLAQAKIPVIFKKEVVNVQGFVEYLDLETSEIRIDGHIYQLRKDIPVTSQDKIIKIDEVSEGDFVIAAIKGDLVLEIALAPIKIVE